MSRMTTGRPSMARKMPSKSPCWSASSWAIAVSKRATTSDSSADRVSPAAARALARVAWWAMRIAPRTISEPLALAEHVLGAAQADALGTVCPCPLGLLGLVGVGPDAHAPDLVGPAEDPLEVRLVLEARRDRGHSALVHLARGAIDG